MSLASASLEPTFFIGSQLCFGGACLRYPRSHIYFALELSSVILGANHFSLELCSGIIGAKYFSLGAIHSSLELSSGTFGAICFLLKLSSGIFRANYFSLEVSSGVIEVNQKKNDLKFPLYKIESFFNIGLIDYKDKFSYYIQCAEHEYVK